MDICNRGHDEVCFCDHRCPVCALQAELDDLKKALENLQAAHDSLERAYEDRDEKAAVLGDLLEDAKREAARLERELDRKNEEIR